MGTGRRPIGNRGPQVGISMGADMIDRIEEYRLAERFPTRTAAVRYLLDFALRAGPTPTTADWQRFSEQVS